MKLPVILADILLVNIYLLSSLKEVESAAFLSLRFSSYLNPNGTLSNGKCCDSKWGVCINQCDHSFHFCVDWYPSTGLDPEKCQYSTFHSGAIINKNQINFDKNVGNLVNPVVWRIAPGWPSVVRLKMKVIDVDDDGDDERVDYIQRDLRYEPSTRGQHLILKGMYGTRLSVEMKVYCEMHYYGSECKKFCEPDLTFDCSSDGDVICKPGFTGAECEVNVDECADSPCDNNGTCVDLINDFRCECAEGYGGKFCEDDIDECADESACEYGHCINIAGSYVCECYKSYTGKRCETFVDPCSSSPCLYGGQCESIQGEVVCHCGDSYTGPFCNGDVDECTAHNPCSRGSTCTNTFGGFTCSCPDGLVGKTCEQDVDECLKSPCYNGATCRNSHGSFTCTCASGFRGNLCDFDIDECRDEGLCHQGSCVNTHGGFHCDCLEGFEGDLCHIDSDECETSRCQNDAVCLNTIGSFSCRCGNGYEGSLCEADINECESDVCKNGGKCTNLDGSFKCACTKYWVGLTCEDSVNECESSPCKNGGSCMDKPEGYMCHCPEGWLGHHCSEDLDECLDDDFCLNGATCTNSQGSYKCTCSLGWKGDRCDQDMDECSYRHIEFCHNGGTCVNTVGGFSCMCPLAWTGDRCETDVDECQNIPEMCGRHGACMNVPGDFMCHCEPGYTGAMCDKDIDECMLHPQVCTYAGNFTHYTPASADVDFANDTFVSSDRLGADAFPLVDDSDSSTDLPKNYSNHFLCTNTAPGYICTCVEPWSGYRCGSIEMATPEFKHSTERLETNGEDNSKQPAVVPGTDDDKDAAFGRARENTSGTSSGNADACTSSPCANMAECVPSNVSGEAGNDSFTCICKGTWTGPRCTKLVVGVPFYLAIRVPTAQHWVVDSGLERLLQESRMFDDKQLKVRSVFSETRGAQGNKLTSVYPVVTADGQRLSDEEVSILLEKLSYKFTNFIHYPLYTGEVGQHFRVPVDGLGDNDPASWYPAPIIAGALLVILLIALLIVKLTRRGFCRQRYDVSEAEDEAKNSNGIENEAFDGVDTADPKKSQEQGRRSSIICDITNPLYGWSPSNCAARPDAPQKEMTSIGCDQLSLSSSASGDGKPGTAHDRKSVCERLQKVGVLVHHGWPEDDSNFNAGKRRSLNIPLNTLSSHPTPNHLNNTNVMMRNGSEYTRNRNSIGSHKYETVDLSQHVNNLDPRINGINNSNDQNNQTSPPSVHSNNMANVVMGTRALKQDAASLKELVLDCNTLIGNSPTVNNQEETDHPLGMSQNLVVRTKVVKMEPVVKQVESKQERRSLQLERKQEMTRQPRTSLQIQQNLNGRRRSSGEESKFKDLRYIDDPNYPSHVSA